MFGIGACCLLGVVGVLAAFDADVVGQDDRAPSNDLTGDARTLDAIRSLAERLVKVGVPDPVGLEYQAVRIRVRGKQSRFGEATVGWIVGDRPRVICWDGGAYPLYVADGDARFEGHVEGLVTRWENTVKITQGFVPFTGHSASIFALEQEERSFHSMHPIQACYLARLGCIE